MFSIVFSLILLAPLIALFYDGYLKNGIKEGFLNVFWYGVVTSTALLFLYLFGLNFVYIVPVLFVFLISQKFLQKK